MWYTSEQIESKYPGVVSEIGAWIGDGTVLQGAVSLGVGARVGSDSVVRSGTFIKSGAYVRSYVSVGSWSVIESGSVIEQIVVLGNKVKIGRGVTVGHGAQVNDNVQIMDGAVIGKGRKGVAENIVMRGDFGDTGKLTGFVCDDGLIITCECFNGFKGGTPDELRQAVSEKYDADHFYFDAIRLIEKWYEGLKR